MTTEEVIENPFFPDGVGKFSFSRAILHSLLNSLYMKPAGYSVSKMFFFSCPRVQIRLLPRPRGWLPSLLALMSTFILSENVWGTEDLPRLPRLSQNSRIGYSDYDIFKENYRG